jgi:hypothetical protein
VFKNVLIIGGIAILVLAVLDMLNIPLEIPTANNTTNAAIGAGMIAAPYLYSRFV